MLPDRSPCDLGHVYPVCSFSRALVTRSKARARYKPTRPASEGSQLTQSSSFCPQNSEETHKGGSDCLELSVRPPGHFPPLTHPHPLFLDKGYGIFSSFASFQMATSSIKPVFDKVGLSERMSEGVSRGF